jgi:protein SCO1/2
MRTWTWILLVVLVLTGCAEQKPAVASKPDKRYGLTGEVIRLDAKNRIATIQHGEIKGWMEAMTMDFPVRDEAEFAKLKPGLKIEAIVNVTEKNYEFWLTDVKPR